MYIYIYVYIYMYIYAHTLAHTDAKEMGEVVEKKVGARP